MDQRSDGKGMLDEVEVVAGTEEGAECPVDKAADAADATDTRLLEMDPGVAEVMLALVWDNSC